MSDKDAQTPRVFLIRHGETEWSKNGRYTGLTDLPLLPSGETRVRASARVVYGPGKLIDPTNLAHVYLSPRRRATRTWEILVEEGSGGGVLSTAAGADKVETTEQIAEWNYGEYEGKLTHEIRAMRKAKGLDPAPQEWDIWRDGCEGGESAEEVSRRLDGLIDRIRKIQKPLLESGKGSRGNVVVVAHGHILRAFVKRFLGYPLEFPLSLQIEPGGIGGLSYQHGNIAEPSLFAGMSFPNEK